MKKYIETEIGPAPHEEDCAQIGSDNYSTRSRKECAAFKAQILRHYPVPAGVDAGVRILVSPHDFGRYREVGLAYLCKAGAEWAEAVEKDEKGVLAHWDEEAMQELGLKTAA